MDMGRLLNMGDIFFGIGVMCIAGAAMFVVGLRLTHKLPHRMCLGLATLTVALTFGYGRVIRDRIVFAKVLPFSNLVVLGNLFPIFSGLLAGLAWGLIPGKAWRKCITIVPLIMIALHVSYSWLFLPVPSTHDDWKGDVCLQTSDYSCSAASAATLLKHHGINASETEMVEKCLTSDRGTTLWGLYRGLKLKTNSTSFYVDVFSGDEDYLASLNGEPVILIVRLDKDAGLDPRYEDDWQWQPGVSHAVVFYNFAEDDLVWMGDPSFGREQWNRQAIRDLWYGYGIRLAKR